MALPFAFANVSVLLTTSLDANFNALGAMSVIPCTASGTNTIALTPNSNTPTISAYTTMSPVFAFIAAGSNSGATTINVNGVGAKTLYKTNGATVVGSGDIISGSLYLVNYNPALNTGAGGWVLINPSVAQSAPTVTRLLSGTAATYTSPAGVVRHRIRQVGGGGGGGAQATNNGTTGGTTSFQVNATGTAWTCIGGGGGGISTSGPVGSGGTGGTNGSTGTLITRFDGASGSMGATASATSSGAGGSSPFGGAAGGVASAAGSAAAANTGSGGSGGSTSTTAGGCGGGSGEYIEFWVTGMTSATYTVGAAGVGGAAGTRAGGNGGAGVVIIEEFYI